MARLIDADQIVYSWTVDNDGEEHDGVTLQSIINKMPTVDAEPVVRCKDCSFCVYDETIDEMWCNGKKVSKDWFCADGKRKEDRLIMPKADGSTICTIPKDGYWVHGKELSRDYIGDVCVGVHYDKLWCSECNYQLEEDEPLWRYCPRCGAKMDEVKSEIWQD